MIEEGKSPCHTWGDKDFDWHALDEACQYFSKNVQRYGRMMCFTKEKYGTMRIEFLNMQHHGIYGFLFPRNLYMMAKYRSMNDFIANIFNKIGLGYILWKYKVLVFNIVTIMTVNKWLHIKNEIIDDLYFDDLLYEWTKKKINYKCNWRKS